MDHLFNAQPLVTGFQAGTLGNVGKKRCGVAEAGSICSRSLAMRLLMPRPEPLEEHARISLGNLGFFSGQQTFLFFHPFVLPLQLKLSGVS